MTNNTQWTISEGEEILTFTRLYNGMYLEIKLDHGAESRNIFEGSLIMPKETEASRFAISPTFYGCFDKLLHKNQDD